MTSCKNHTVQPPGSLFSFVSSRRSLGISNNRSKSIFHFLDKVPPSKRIQNLELNIADEIVDRHNCFPSHSNAGSAGSVAGGFQLNARTVLSAVSRVAARFILALMSSAAAEAMLATCENSTKTTTEIGLKRRVLSKHSLYRNVRN